MGNFPNFSLSYNCLMEIPKPGRKFFAKALPTASHPPDVAATGAPDTEELSRGDWVSLRSWPRIREMGKQHVLRFVVA